LINLRMKQETIYKGNDWWQWAIWLDGSKDELDKVSRVVYTLHPTFPIPVQCIDNRKNNFRLDSSGWGEFEIFIKIVYKDGQVRKRRHWLKLEYHEPAKRRDVMQKEESDVDSAKKTVLFLSSTVSDANTAGILRRILSKHNIRVTSPDEVPLDMPMRNSIERMINDADMAVFVISGRPSLWMNHEIELTLAKKGRPVVPVLIGEGSELPPILKEFQAVKVKDISELESVAEQIIKKSLPVK